MKQIEVIKLLEWAYRQELPKAERAVTGAVAAAPSSWGMVYDFGVLGTVIDAPVNRYGVVAATLEAGDPHPDATIVARAVDALGEAAVEIGAGFSPFGDWTDADGLVAESVAARLPRLQALTGREIRTMVIARAVLGHRAAWRGSEPGRVMVTRAGRPCWFVQRPWVDELGRKRCCEVDGFNPRTRRPVPGAYRKYRLAEDVGALAEERFRRAVWALAVRAIAAKVAGRLSDHELTATVPTVAPWEGVEGGRAATSVKTELVLKY